MLDAIADFWKPIKKAPPQNKPKLADLKIGSLVSFGYMPQMAISGRKLNVSAINTYQFGADVLTSFVLSREKEADVSMIIADAQGDQYLAISRKLSPTERSKLFAENTIFAIISKTDASKLNCRDNVPELKGWMALEYKREIQGMKGFLHSGDFREGKDKLNSGDEFSYTLLGSDSNEHALEIEEYKDGRVEVYATIYRKTSDINDVVYEPVNSLNKADVKLVSQNSDVSPVAKALLSPTLTSSPTLEPVLVKEEKKEVIKLEEVKLPELEPTPLAPIIEKAEIVEAEKAAEITEKKAEKKPTEKLVEKSPEENKEMSITPTMSSETKSFGSNGHDYNGALNGSAGKIEMKAEGKVVNGMDGESISCDLKVANQIIDEAIRSEMRLSDVVRRIIELPVAHQEAVQIPITLSDDDYSLLAIRYSISASDKNAIKTRIIQDLGDFSGKKK
jgi:hypothetical protein